MTLKTTAQLCLFLKPTNTNQNLDLAHNEMLNLQLKELKMVFEVQTGCNEKTMVF